MRDRPLVYAQHQYASSSEPRYVVSIEFTPASFEHFASHTGIADLPVGAIESCVENFSSVSQSFDPETGASRIGSLTVLLGDIGEAITDAFQARLVAGNGVRDKQLRFYKGFEGMSFNDFELKWTQDVHEVSEDHARYKISCSDIQRAMRTEIFELKNTVLDATLSATAATATVADTSEFILVEHGTSYSHGPSATWGYFKIDDEIIGYTGKTGITFTGLDRGLFNTLQAEHVVDPADPPERRPEIEEYVYLEMPIPKMVKALLTGVLHGQGAATLPTHWHMGIDITLIEDSQFTGIGVDLWDPANDAVGLIARFTEIDSIDGKQFIEKECFLLAQIFSPVLADGTLGLRRFTPALATASHLVTLNESNVQKHTSLKHSMREVFNRIVLNWSWIAGEFRRQTIKLDTDSIAKHGEAPIKIYNFRGLAANIATLSVLTQRFDAIRDRFSAPPLSMNCDVSKSLDRMELGDVVLVQLPNVRDMAADSVNEIDRAFEIRQIREDRKRLTFVLNGSSAEALPVAPLVNALANAFYDSAGTELSTVVPITGGVTDAGTTTLVGAPLMANSIFYFIGNLTIAATTTLNLDDNVQLRVQGFLTVNGVLNGDARGLLGVADSVDTSTNPKGITGFFGATVGGDGAEHDAEFDAFFSRKGRHTGSAFGSVPHLNLNVVGNALDGLPTELRGTSGGPGGKLVHSFTTQVGGGGTGGPGGSGLMIICRGISFGGGASIDLGGGDGLAGTEVALQSHQFFPGGGGGGAPGALYILLDGNRLVPDLSTVFSAIGGATPIDGTPMPEFFSHRDQLASPATGFKDDTRRLSSVDWTAGAFRVQFIPVPETPVEDLPDPDLAVYYILATNGNAIHNGTGTLTLEAHRLLAGSDELLSAGTIKLFDPSDNEVTVANGYVTGSDGFTGILDSGDIAGDIVITLKDGPTGSPLDTITLVDVADGDPGAPGSDGADAVYGIVEPENGLAWTRAVNEGAWTPSQATTDLDCTFFQAGAPVARIARRITLNTADGTLTAAAIAHKGGDLNTSRVNVTLIGNGSTAETVQFDYSFGGEDASVAETVSTSQGGDHGASSHGVLVNGGFETGDDTGWTVSPTGTVINDGTARTGTYYVRIASGAGGPNRISDRYAAPAVGREVRFSGFARRDESDQPSTDASIAVRFYDSADAAVGGRVGAVIADRLVADWQALEGVAVVPATAVTFAFDCGESTGTGAWEFDDLSAIVEAVDGDPGAPGDDGADAIHGSIEPENGLAWTRAANGGAWSPAQLTTDLDCVFEQAGVEVARIARRITLTSADGTLAVSTEAHKDGDLNTSRVTVTAINPGTQAVTVQFDYSFGGESASVAATVNSNFSGNDGAPGFSTSYVYDDLDTTGLAAGASRYAILTDRLLENSGDQNDFSLADGLLLNKADLAAANDLELYYPSVIVGDRVTYWISVNRWYLYEIESVEPSGGSGTTLRFRWGVKLIEFAEDSNANISTAPGTPVQFQFNRAEIGNFKDVKFKRSATVPATPTGDNPVGWTDDIPAGSDAIYQTTGLKTFAGALIGVWATPIRIQGLVNRGAYSAGTAYLPDDMVLFAERSYICTTATTGNDPSGTNAGNTWWDLLAGKGDPGDPPTPFIETIVVPAGGTQNLRALANAHTPAYDGIADATITFTVAPAVVINGNAGGGHGIDTGVWPSGSATIILTLENDGIVRGGGGVGGKGGNRGNQNGSPGLNGGDAIFCQEDITIDNAPLGPGLIEASGGGGGGGGGCTTSGGEPVNHGGGGGGGGFPNASGGAGGIGDGGNDGAAGSVGTTGGGGSGGGGSDGGGCIAGDGGNGGNVNVNGSGGATATGGQANASGGSGGTRGFAVRKNGHTVTVTGGTVTGQVG